jgi:hypothetical protein
MPEMANEKWKMTYGKCLLHRADNPTPLIHRQRFSATLQVNFSFAQHDARPAVSFQ